MAKKIIIGSSSLPNMRDTNGKIVKKMKKGDYFLYQVEFFNKDDEDEFNRREKYRKKQESFYTKDSLWIDYFWIAFLITLIMIVVQNT